MMQNLLIFSLCIVTIQATGEFTILSTPKSLHFKGNEAIKSSDIGDVFSASLGKSIAEGGKWNALEITDPFNMPKSIMAIILDGVAHSKLFSAGKTFAVQDNTAAQSLNGVVAQLEADNEPVCSIDFEQHQEGINAFKNTIGDVEVSAIAKTKYLNAGLHTADKQYLESLAHLKAIVDNLGNMQKSCKFLYIHFCIEPIAKAHGENSEAVNEALDLFYTYIKYLNDGVQKSSNNEALVGVIVNKAESSNSRSKREVVDPSKDNQYNLAEYYNQDYPVIFNIILWFMVVFGFALLAICYAIGSMDPGRDSIIYRMTSTRMKKDN